MRSPDPSKVAGPDRGQTVVQVELHHGAHGSTQVLRISGDLDLQGIQELRTRLLGGLPTVLKSPGGSRLGVTGPDENGAAPSVVTELDGPLSGAEPPARQRAVLLDLAGVAFMDSLGISLLINLQRHLQKVGQALALCCLQDQPRQLLALTTVDTILAVHTCSGDVICQSP